MYVVPLIERDLQRRETYTLQQIWILLERNGTHLIEVTDVPAGREFAVENGLTIREERVVGDVLFLVIEQTPSLADFYTWDETPPGTQPMREVWRPFLWCGSRDPLGIHGPLHEIEVSTNHTIGSLLTIWATPVV